MTNISKARENVHREMEAMLAIVERPGVQQANDAEVAVWSAALRLGAAVMTLFFERQAERWPSGHRYEDDAGVAHEVAGADVVEIGTRFGKVSVRQPMGRAIERRRGRRDMPMARELGLPGGFTLPLVALVAKF